MRISSTVLKSLAVAAVGTLALTACGNSDTPAASSDASGITLISEGKLTVCSDIPYEPFEFTNKEGKIVGFDMDIAAEIAKDMEVELSVIDSSFDAIESGLFKTQCDIAISSVSITDARKGNMDFSSPYMDDDLTLVAKEGSGVTDLESAKGKKVGVQQATTGAKFAKENGLDAIGYEDSGLQLASLKAGTTVATLGNQSVLGYAIKDDPTLKRVADFTTGEQLGVAVPKGATAMLDQVNTTLKRLTDDGSLAKFTETWFGATN
ncbi:ABC transporter substrate-binding protein [Paeniglutamicibacter gangotriensis]|uniref:Family 3 extracellular solute-binding protein n=2 Tax=Paeniglutamicibacter gangotriensis TaxID=254787 RepID=M7MVD1_9MICC|nr:ABC transporter substrate-binding protein [Paeniglutamicibacter gangotriensis]EMQ98996.1 family 3 extracellular solute-binding protein [Paeniglutamicibacter gangotriensis Lz1y]KAA0974332.1 amino acid ABC transporter substrate-binding protein [Paeniglutamicibacter gangotriensis]